MAIDYIRESFSSTGKETYDSNLFEDIFDIEKSKTKNNGESIMFYTVKVKDYMNLLGKYINELLQKTECNINDLIVISDDLDLELGGLKIDKNIGGGNHKGILSIINSLFTKNFMRIRIGAGTKPQKENENLSVFVLKKLIKKEKDILDLVLFDLPAIIEDIIMKDFSFVQSKYNGKKPLDSNFNM